MERYRLQTIIGTGGMSRVWLAHDDLLDRPVAVKELVPVPGIDAELWTRTVQEGRAAARLTHPNVVRVYDVLLRTGPATAAGGAWIVMEHVPGRDLDALVRAAGPLPPGEAARMAMPILAALTAAHRTGVLHRDVKPHNVLIADDGRILLGDFGVALLDAAPDAGPLVASPGYLAPERLSSGVSTALGDLWSFGATLYFMVEGRPPYARATTPDQLAALAAQEPDPMVLAGPLAPVIAGLLRREPGERLTAAAAARLLAALAAVPSGTATDAAAADWGDGSVRRSVALVAGVTAFAALGGAVAAAIAGTPWP